MTKDQLLAALKAAGKAHHEYESNYLTVKHDRYWAGWYAAYVLGQLGEFVSPATLTRWLEEAPSESDLFEVAAEFVSGKLSS